MYQLDFKKPTAIHFIGIGGISMSGLAQILLKEGFVVSGSDSTKSPLTTELERLGANIYYGQRRQNITDDISVVVYTAAVKQDNPELDEARKRKIPTLTRAELLGQFMLNYKQAVNIAGTHGKTTTTSMVSEILLQTNLDPTISVGGILPSIGGNIRVGSSEAFVTEACEYTNSFLSFFPTMEVILNIEADHMDFFHNLDEIYESFHLFAKKLTKDGTLIINSEIKYLSKVTDGLDCNIITFGFNGDETYVASNIVYNEMGYPSYTLSKKGITLGTIQLQVPGLHNVSNSLAAASLALELNIDFLSIQKGLFQFTGTNRRFQKKGELGGITIIDDYAHHPSEITATLTAARNYPHKKIICVFQPHTYTRTKAFFDEFATALSLADTVVLADIYPARETDTLGMSSKLLEEKIKELGTNAYYFPTFDEIENFLLENCINGDLLITMGAGDVVKIGESLLGN